MAQKADAPSTYRAVGKVSERSQLARQRRSFLHAILLSPCFSADDYVAIALGACEESKLKQSRVAQK